MKPSGFTIRFIVPCLAIIAGSSFGADDPFDGKALSRRPSPVHDTAYYAQRARDDLVSWRGYLKKIGEPDLEQLQRSPATEVYRFVYTPHFSKTLVLTAKKTDGTLAFDVRRFSEKDLLELKGSLDMDGRMFEDIQEQFREPKVYDPLGGITAEQRDVLWGLDGAWWHLETLRNGNYTHAVVWSPETIERDYSSKKDSDSFRKQFGFAVPDIRPFVAACLALVRFSGLPLDVRIYDPRPEPSR